MLLTIVNPITVGGGGGIFNPPCGFLFKKNFKTFKKDKTSSLFQPQSCEQNENHGNVLCLVFSFPKNRL